MSLQFIRAHLSIAIRAFDPFVLIWHGDPIDEYNIWENNEELFNIF
jgi:hypothetical protein